MLPFGSVANVWSGGNFWLSGNKHKQVTLLSVPLIKHEHHCNCSEGRGGLILSFCDVCGVSWVVPIGPLSFPGLQLP